MQRWHVWALALSTCWACGDDAKPSDLRLWTPEDHAQPADVDPARVPTEAANEAPDPTRSARALWKVACAGCHGVDGHGGGPSLSPGASVPDFGAGQWQDSRSDQELARTIHEGRNLMPPFGKQVTPEGIAALVAHVRSLRSH